MKSILALVTILFLNLPLIDTPMAKEYSGWWIYGDSFHLFKDEKSLKEFEISFLKERKEDLELLYLEVAEMEYFPVDCNINGYVRNDTLFVFDLKITYVKGCGEY
jgi:hypothetical protein